MKLATKYKYKLMKSSIKKLIGGKQFIRKNPIKMGRTKTMANYSLFDNSEIAEFGAARKLLSSLAKKLGRKSKKPLMTPYSRAKLPASNAEKLVIVPEPSKKKQFLKGASIGMGVTGVGLMGYGTVRAAQLAKNEFKGKRNKK
jgi:hypothetical protein